ncbi:MAG: sulfur carrier protein ThiS [Acidobacteria bacterium]|nr:sulfur carrier protein ThiS [Acidobacteriota bacterium]
MNRKLEIIVNGQKTTLSGGGRTVQQLVRDLDLRADHIAVEVNEQIVSKKEWPVSFVENGDRIEIVHFVGGGASKNVSDKLVIGGREFQSRLIVGSGKYESLDLMRRALEASGADMVTVAVRRVDLSAKESLLNYIDRKRFFILPNTAGCYTAQDAIRYAHLAREAGLSEFVKLEVIGDERTLFPDNGALLEATRVLVKEGFVVLPYTNDDPVVCKKLEEAGAAAVMPLGAPIGSGLGIQNPNNIRIILENASVPVIVDAGVGTASDATIAMELGVDGVLMNSGIAGAKDPVTMAQAMKLAVEAGRLAFFAGRIPKKMYATASSPLEGMLT